MFLFFSKLLPLFVYPLGLAFCLMTVALVVMGKRPRMAAGCLMSAMGVLWFSSSPLAVNVVIGSLEARYSRYADIAALPTAEAIVILGGATYEPLPPRSFPEVNEAGDRVFQAARLYAAGKAPVIILSGGRIRWSQQETPDQSEAQDMATLLTMMGNVSVDNFILEPTSLNTYQNAINVQQILQEQAIETILLVTSAFHMPRALAIFHKLGIDAIPAPTDFYIVDQPPERFSLQQLLLDLLPSVGNLEKTSRGVKEYIGIVVYWLRGWI